MLGTALAQMRFSLALAFGRPIPLWTVEKLIQGARETQRELGPIPQKQADEVMQGPLMDAESLRDISLGRFRQQAVRAAKGTRFYREYFAQSELRPDRLSLEEIARLPVVTKEELRLRPDDFVHEREQPYLIASSTGTTGIPTRTAFSLYELKLIAGMSALSWLLREQIHPEDIVMISNSTRGLLGNWATLSGCAYIGAATYMTGIINPDQSLDQLTRSHNLPGKREKVNLLIIYPSYLGELIEAAHRRGLGPKDFGLERISIGGEPVSTGVLERAREVFGDVQFDGGYAMTETYPYGGVICEQGHMHFEATHGLLEILDPETHRAVDVGEVGSLVATPFPPFRQTTILLRYLTNDLVRPLGKDLTCSMRRLAATTPVLGKAPLSVRLEDGTWVTPLSIVEALESLRIIRLPARFGFWAQGRGVAVEVVADVAGKDSSAVRGEIAQALEAQLEPQGVPLDELRLVEHASELQKPFPWRCDLREGIFIPPSSVVGA